MTIRKRLSISNTLMLVIPVLLSMIIFSVMVFIVVNIFGITNPRSKGLDERFNFAVGFADALANEIISLSDLSDIKESVDSFNKRYGSSEMFLTAYIEGTPLYPESADIDSRLLDMAISGEDGTTIIKGKTAVYRVDSGETSLLLIAVDYTDLNFPVENWYYFFGILILLVLLLIIMFTNKALTRYVFKSIMTPINTLTYGVHQIRDGNLDYRISYNGEDELAVVCSDFNEMAERLLESVNRRQKDDANRKELIAGISHDLRTPLTSIKAYLEGIERDVANTAEQKTKYFNIIKGKAAELENIINQLHLFSKIDIGEFPFHLERVDIHQELTEIASGFSDEHKDFSVFLLPSNAEIYADIDIQQFRNAIINIMGNSVKYKDKETGMIEISCRVIDDEAVIELTDDGPGVPEESLDRLFDVFYRGDPARNDTASGSGLGLAITAKVIEGMGGGITARNAKGGGLSITIKLQLSRKGD